MRNQLILFLNAVAAGISIGIGGWVYIICSSKIAGAALFSIGLFMVCSRKYNLYTGKIGYAVTDKNLHKNLIQIWAGNFAGAFIVGTLFRFTRMFTQQSGDTVRGIVSGKIDDTWYGIFILAVFCGILMFFAVDTFNSFDGKPLFQELGVLLGVMVFILCGFNHCVADMFYITAAGMWSVKALIYILIVTIGNSVGSIIFSLIKYASKKQS